jgi:hypothetical protein
MAFNGVGGPLKAPANIFFNRSSVSRGFMAVPQNYPAEYNAQTVSKLAAGRRQLDCAIEMWFADKDQVAVHTLSVAAHQIIHDIHDHQRPERPLFLNHPLIKAGHQAEFIKIFKEAANFFKHAERDPNPGSTVEFSPFITQIFFVYAIHGLTGLGESLTDTESAYLSWFSIHHPEFANPEFIKGMADAIPAKYIATMRGLKKLEFFKTCLEASARNRTTY